MRTRFNVAQKKFELNRENTLREILNDKNFADVTLACNDGRQVNAHRIILSSQSLFFKQILEANNKNNVLLYLHEVSSDELESILEFLYLGHTEISEQCLTRFLFLGHMFQISGLVEHDINISDDKDFTKKVIESGYEGEGLLINKSVWKRQPNGKFPCDQCDFQSAERRHVQRHINTVHLGIKHACDECSKEYGDPHELKLHKKSAHEGVYYECGQCNKTFSLHRRLLQHEREHAGINTKCTQCDISFKSLNTLNYHVLKYHDGLKYVCDICGFRARKIFKLKEHKGTMHV